MPDSKIHISYAGDEESIAILSVSGPLVEETAPALERVLEEQLALDKFKIIVNLENTRYIASAGWGVFVSEIREIRDNDGDLVLVNMSSDVYEVYVLMDFASILKSFESVDEAIVHFTGDLEKKPVTSKHVSRKPQLKPEPLPAQARTPEKEIRKQAG